MYRSTLIFLALAMLSVSVFPAFAQATAAPVSNTLLPGEDIRIGMVNALSGPASALGAELKQGAQLYFNKTNAAGGIHGRQLRLISYDDGYEPARTIAHTRTLIEKDNAFLLFGYVGTPTSRVAMPIAARAGIPYIAPFTGASFLRQPVQPYVINIRAGYDDETEELVAYLVDTLHLTRIGMLVQNDGYGSAGRAGVQKALQKRNLTMAGVGKYQRNTTDILPALSKLRAASPQAVIMVGAYEPCAAFIRESKKREFNPVFMNISFVGTNGLLSALGEAGEGSYISQVMPSPQTSELAIVKQYRSDMAEAGQTTFSYGSLEGYVNAVALVKMLDKAGIDLTRQKVVSATQAMVQEDIGGLMLQFGPQDHQGLNNVYLTQVKNGKAVQISTQPLSPTTP